MSTYYVFMNLTLSVDEAAVERARAVARQQGTSLNALVREFIERLGGARPPTELARRLEELWRAETGRASGGRIRREDAYEGRL